jgi:hypothetical protein
MFPQAVHETYCILTKTNSPFVSAPLPLGER